MTAVYQPIPNTNYLVSNTGEVVRTDNKPVSARPSKNGAYYTLKIGNKWSSYRAAKLVLFAFRQVPLSEQTRIKYRDNNPLNAALDNLNTDFVVENPNAILAASRVFKFDENGELVATYHSAYAASKANDIAYSVISQVARSGQFWRGAFYRYSDQFDKADLAQVAARRHVRLVRSTTANTLYQYDLAGNYVQSFHTPADVQVALNKNDISHIYKVMRGVRANAFGFIWSRKRHSNVIRYKEQQYDIVKRNATTGEIVDRAFGYAEAAKKFGKSLSGIYNCVSLQQADRQNFRYEKQLLHKI